MIHLDTGFLIRALVPGSAESAALEGWLSAGEPLGVSAVAWTEFLCGPVLPAHVEAAASLFGRPASLDGPEAARAATLFVLGGRRRHSLADCMIAATAIEAGARLATTNPTDFARFAEHGLRLAWPAPPGRRLPG
ncbi:MAG TPA: PIN domain-containing protein [Candidatus Binatia bacterium]|nr:PIN domain-containing protein [Candidatus Binatia bacterium]